MKLLILICGLFATVFANHDSGRGASYGGGDHADHKAAHAVTDHHAAHHAKHAAVAHHGHDDHKAAAHHGHVHVHDHHGHHKKHAAPAHHGHHDHKAAAHRGPAAHGSRHRLSNHPSSHKAADKKKPTQSQIKKIHDYVISNDYQAKIAKAASKVRVSGAVMYKHLLKHNKKTTPKDHSHKTHHFHKKQPKHTTGPLHENNYFETPDMYRHLGPVWNGAPKQFETPYAYRPEPPKYERGYNLLRHSIRPWDIEEPKYGPKPHLGFPFSGLHESHVGKPNYGRPPRPYAPQPLGPIYTSNEYQPQPYAPVHDHYNERPKSPKPYPNGPFSHGKVDYKPRPAEPRYEPEQYKPMSFDPRIGHFETPYYH